MHIWGIVRADAILLLAQYAAGDLKQPNLTLRGNVAVEAVLTSAGGLVPSAAALDNGAVVAGQTIAIGIAEQYVFSQVGGNWVRAIALADGDATPSVATPAQVVITHGQVFNGATWDQMRSRSDITDGQAAGAGIALAVSSRLQGLDSNNNTYYNVHVDGTSTENVPQLFSGSLRVNAHPRLFNGIAFDREQNNVDQILLASGARGATTTSPDFTNFNQRGSSFVINVTIAPGIVTVTPSIQVKDSLSGQYITVLTGAAIVAASTVRLVVYPGITAVAGLSASDILSRTYRVVVTHSGVGSFTYSVGGSLIR